MSALEYFVPLLTLPYSLEKMTVNNPCYLFHKNWGESVFSIPTNTELVQAFIIWIAYPPTDPNPSPWFILYSLCSPPIRIMYLNNKSEHCLVSAPPMTSHSLCSCLQNNPKLPGIQGLSLPSSLLILRMSSLTSSCQLPCSLGTTSILVTPGASQTLLSMKVYGSSPSSRRLQ